MTEPAMTEPTLYRVYIGPGWVSDPMDVVNDLIDEGVLVPVEPDIDKMAVRIVDWTYEPEGETPADDLARQIWEIGGSR